MQKRSQYDIVMAVKKANLIFQRVKYSVYDGRLQRLIIIAVLCKIRVYIFADIFRPTGNLFSGTTMGEKIKFTIIILIIAFFLFVYAGVIANIHRDEWKEEKEAESRSE